MSLSEKFFAAKPRLKEFKVEGMDEPLYIRPLSLGQRGKFGDSAKAAEAEDKSAEEKLRSMTVPLVIGAVVDNEGKPVFKEDAADRLMEFDGGILIKIQDAILEHSGLTAAAKDKLEKNSETAQSDTPSSQ